MSKAACLAQPACHQLEMCKLPHKCLIESSDIWYCDRGGGGEVLSRRKMRAVMRTWLSSCFGTRPMEVIIFAAVESCKGNSC